MIGFRWHELIYRQFYSITSWQRQSTHNWNIISFFVCRCMASMTHATRLAFIDFLFLFGFCFLVQCVCCFFFLYILQLKSSCYNLKNHRKHPFDLGFNECVNWIYVKTKCCNINGTPFRLFDVVPIFVVVVVGSNQCYKTSVCMKTKRV